MQLSSLNCVFSNGSPGANELAVQKAKAEITRLIKEELIRLVSGPQACLVSVTLSLNFNTHRRGDHKLPLASGPPVVTAL